MIKLIFVNLPNSVVRGSVRSHQNSQQKYLKHEMIQLIRFTRTLVKLLPASG